MSKAQISIIIQSGGLLGKLLGPLLKTGLPLIKKVIKPLAKSVLAPLDKAILGSGTTTLGISNEEINDIMKIVQALEDSSNCVTKTIKNETKEQKGGFLSMFLSTLRASLLLDLLTKNYQEKELLELEKEL